ncbi:MAG: excinuclease ABC subunit UvrA [Cryomorphaceae bacterium]|nr:excinuclease ABC subunit UvrA [Cryomorphaceae bacterium]
MNTTPELDIVHFDSIDIKGAREHNLKNLDINIPREKLVVITGLSGSGKSSLAFDTIYAEGQRRYVETFSAYARQFMGNMERPDVDKIDGLSPVIAIEQKTTSKNPRSTVGTITEVYDFLRLLFARVSNAYSMHSGKKMVSYTDQQIIREIEKAYEGKKINLLSPRIRARKGHYRELFEQIARMGFVRVRINGEIKEITKGMKLNRYQTHDIEIVIDRLIVRSEDDRLKESLNTAMYHGDGMILIVEEENGEPRYFSRKLMCPDTGIAYPEPEPNSFSFNSPKGACSHCNGLGHLSEVDMKKVVPDDSLSIKNGGLAPLGTFRKSWIFSQIEIIGDRYNFSLDTPVRDLPEEGLNVIFHGANETFEVENKVMGITRKLHLNFDGLIPYLKQQSKDVKSRSIQKWAGNYMENVSCSHCEGHRLRKESLHFKINNQHIGEIAALSLNALAKWLDEAEKNFSATQALIGTEIVKEIRTRVQFLLDVGLGYLALNRSSKHLSGGEAQRIRLATQIGTDLVGVLYILDEPSIGLHQRDNTRLINSLYTLRDKGNSVIVVEHDRDMMEQADHLIDMGPGAGRFGGEIVEAGDPRDIIKSGTGMTAQYMRDELSIPFNTKPRKGTGKYLEIIGATGHNLKNVHAKFPLGTFTVVTGVSGSGKSSLVNETLSPILHRELFRNEKKPLPYQDFKGLEHIDKVITIDQSPIGRTPRSNPATYTGVWSDIRTLFTQLPESKVRGYKPGRFSFNVKGGRCETCEGAGVKVIEMNFLPDVHVHCETCQGKRFNRETLEIRYKGKSISDILEMSINEAVKFFEHIPKIFKKIETLQQVGLGYLTLGQASTTLSGGEAQRVKLSSELSRRDTGNTLYILDEPTTGLHFEDIRVLLDVLFRLVDHGNTVLVIEHNLDVIKSADYIIDIGPEAGEAGGEIIATGSPKQLVNKGVGYTAEYLAKEYGRTRS